MQDRHSKTEDATPKRLRDARNKGQVSKSGDLNSAASFLVFALLLGTLGDYLLKRAIAYITVSLSGNYGRALTAADTGTMLTRHAMTLLVIFLPFGLIAIFTGVLTNIVQVGFLFTAEPLKPDFKRLNPMEGMKNIFSKKSLFTTAKNLMKLFIVAYITYTGLEELMVPLMNLGGVGVEKLFPFFMDTVASLSVSIAGLMLVLGIVDYIFQKRDFKKNLMMTKDEIREEYKQMEGDPKIKSKRQQKMREMSMARTMQGVESSTVIITNPTHFAIALRYEEGKDEAPVVMAKGMDYMALKIREKAKEMNIPVIENKPLARAMYHKVEAGSSVPVEMYQAVAEILALVFTMNQKKKLY